MHGPTSNQLTLIRALGCRDSSDASELKLSCLEFTPSDRLRIRATFIPTGASIIESSASYSRSYQTFDYQRVFLLHNP